MPAPYISDDDIASTCRHFIARTLPKREWTHAGHFAAALGLLALHPEVDCPRDMPDMIRAYNVATGVANTDTSGYHETITQASIRVARAFLSTSPDGTLCATFDALMGSPFGKPDWLSAYWTDALLFSAEARRRWVEPDIGPLPF
jgi:hypothetical protein